MGKSIYLLTERTQLLEHCAFHCLLHVSAVFGHHRADFKTCMEENNGMVASRAQLKEWKNFMQTSIV